WIRLWHELYFSALRTLARNRPGGLVERTRTPPRRRTVGRTRLPRDRGQRQPVQRHPHRRGEERGRHQHRDPRRRHHLSRRAGQNTVSEGSPYRTRGNTLMEFQIVQIVNAQRALYGLPGLTINYQLNAAAALHTADMVSISNLSGPYAGMQHVLYGTLRPQP